LLAAGLMLIPDMLVPDILLTLHHTAPDIRPALSRRAGHAPNDPAGRTSIRVKVARSTPGRTGSRLGAARALSHVAGVDCVGGCSRLTWPPVEALIPPADMSRVGARARASQEGSHRRMVGVAEDPTLSSTGARSRPASVCSTRARVDSPR
jgi:hypothetical protein